MRAKSESIGVSPASIILAALSLLAIGVVMVASASSSLDRPLLGPAMWHNPFGRQVIFAVIGVALMLGSAYGGIRLLDYQFVRRRLPWIVFFIALACLAVALVPGIGDSRHGSQRWLRFAPGGIDVGFQPSEVAKLALVLILAAILGGDRSNPRKFFLGFTPAALVSGLCIALVGKENFGTAALLAGVAGIMMLIAGCRLHHLLILVGLGGFGLSVLLFAAPYRMERLTAHKNLWADPAGDGYQPIQSLVTIATGGWLGAGLGSGLQKYGYLPESHSDFVFAIICEELGFFGGAFMVFLFCGFGWLGMRVMLSAQSSFERLLAFGLTLLVLLQAIINISVVTVVAPTTGVPLPFVSAGGSGIFVMSTMVGLLAAIAARTHRNNSESPFELPPVETT